VLIIKRRERNFPPFFYELKFLIIFASNKTETDMILINQNKLEPSAFSNPDHPMHAYALEYEKGLKALNKRFPKGEIEFRK
jgi:hypothetical protein